MNKNIIMSFGVVAIIFSFGFVFAQTTGTPSNPNIGNQIATVCCEKTNTGAFCQNVPSAECLAGSRQVPTNCQSTSYCRGGTCYDSTEGTCLDNTPQLVCENNEGVWSKDVPPQCDLGCCILGNQAAYVSLVRCKRLSAFLGLETNYDKSISNEVACINTVQQQDRGACVYEFEFEKTCKFTTRAECGAQTRGNATLQSGTFFEGKLCSAEELGTNCGQTTKTTCVEGKDEVYFVDTCGNPANIYDASKIEDQEYWTNVKSKSESCNANAGNSLNTICGNCDYLAGSICRDENVAGKKPSYGDFICADLNCKTTQNGKGYRHGESWCVYNDAGGNGDGSNTVGSRFYKHICTNGKEVLEQCEDFRAEECIEQKINGFSQAACRVNRWQDCINQKDKESCENIERRDCLWREGILLQTLQNTSSGEEVTGTCFAKNKPGFNFWADTESASICSLGSSVCIVKFEKGLLGGEKCVENCECLKETWEKKQATICSALGDCGPSLNWRGQEGYNKGYKIETKDVEETE